MRAIIMLLFLAVAGTSYAEDPLESLESLNTVEDTISTMQGTLKSQGLGPQRSMMERGAAVDFLPADPLYFISEQPFPGQGWVAVRPCSDRDEAFLSALEAGSFGAEADREAADERRLWKSRLPEPADLRPGTLVVALDKVKDGKWYLTKIVDTADLGNGYVTISAPFKAQLANIRVIEE